MDKSGEQVQAEALQLCCLMTGRGGDAEAGRRSAMDRNESPVACAMRVMAYGLLQELLLLPE